MKRILLSLITFISLSNGGFSQNVGISATGAATDNSAGLDVNFTNKGLLIPRVNLTSVTDVTTIPTPANSLLVYNLNTRMVGGSSGYWYWNGAMWMKFKTGMDGTEWTLSGNSGTTVGTNFLGTTDVQDFAIYTNNAERIRVQAGGNVGIGTTSPQRLFHIAQNSSGTPSMLALDNADTTVGNGMSLSFRGTTTGAGAVSFKEFSSIQSIFDVHDYATRASSLVFYTSARGYISERMRISTDGYIGIGNVAPSNALHVTAAANPLRLEGLQTGAGTDQMLTVDATGVVRQQTAASMSSLTSWSKMGNSGTTAGTNFLGTTDAQDFVIYSNNAERIRVQASGNVGIGTINPQRLLHVSQNNSGTPSMFALENPNTTDGNGLSLSFRGTTTGSGAGSFKEFASIQSVYSTHDNATLASSLRFYTANAGSIKERLRISTDGYIGIGIGAPSNALHVYAVSNPLRLEGLQTGAGTDQMLTVDATGVVRQQTTASMLSLNSWSKMGNAGTVDSTNFIGTTDNVPFNIRVNNQKAGRIDNTNSIAAFGYQSLDNNTGSNNTSIGQESMYSNTTGSNNTANGKSALYSNTTGIGNTVNGFAALFSNTTGSYNMANGYYSLVSNTTGKDNTASGSSALNSNTTGNQNTGIGSIALNLNTTGNGNTANGKGSLSNNTTGSYNASYGYNSGIINTSGNNNTFIGYQANASFANLTNATAIGYAAVAGASNTMALGGTGANQVSVGIGTTNPKSYLETAGSFGTAIITTTSSMTLNSSHYTVVITGGTPAITLPVAGTENNRRSYRIINQRLLLPVTISPYIDFTGLSASTVPPQSKIEIQSDGINWYRVD